MAQPAGAQTTEETQQAGGKEAGAARRAVPNTMTCRFVYVVAYFIHVAVVIVFTRITCMEIRIVSEYSVPGFWLKISSDMAVTQPRRGGSGGGLSSGQGASRPARSDHSMGLSKRNGTTACFSMQTSSSLRL